MSAYRVGRLIPNRSNTSFVVSNVSVIYPSPVARQLLQSIQYCQEIGKQPLDISLYKVYNTINDDNVYLQGEKDVFRENRSAVYRRTEQTVRQQISNTTTTSCCLLFSWKGARRSSCRKPADCHSVVCPFVHIMPVVASVCQVLWMGLNMCRG
jgi:hypothetical protein